MRAAIYARYSSENQRPESITDQVSACSRFAEQHGHTVLEDHVYCDKALSGARKDRPSLKALMDSALTGAFEMVLVDDLSRLARNNQMMLTVLLELEFEGVKVVGVADGVDSSDQDAKLEIGIRGLFNEIQLEDLKKKTLRGQLGQKERGYFVGERTFGYSSVPMGEMRMDKAGHLRPEGYGRQINPEQAANVLRVFREFADGKSQTSIVQTLNREGVPGPYKKGNRWSPSTLHRMLTNEKYIGRWTWNKTGSRRDPKTSRKRQYVKPEAEWIVHEDEALRIVPEELWEKVQRRKQETRKTWPGGKGQRGFSGQRGSKEKHYPTHLLSGAMTCGSCGSTIGQVSGKSGGYYGCFGAVKHVCDNKVLVPRKRAEKIIVGAISERIQDAEQVRYVLEQVEKEISKLQSTLPEEMKIKEAELASQQRRLENIVNAIAEGRDSKTLGDALLDTEKRVEALREEVEGLRASRERVFKVPPVKWIAERLRNLQEVLEGRTEKSALLLRDVLGPIRLEPVTDAEKPFYRAKTALDTLALVETPHGEPSPKGSSALRERRGRCPVSVDRRHLCRDIGDTQRREISCGKGAVPGRGASAGGPLGRRAGEGPRSASQLDLQALGPLPRGRL